MFKKRSKEIQTLLAKFRKMSKFRRILLTIAIALVIALVLSYIVTNALEYYESTQVVQLTPTSTYTISNETRFAPPFEAVIKKGSFDSIAEVYVYIFSPYASYWNTFSVWMSLKEDNSSWISVPFLNFTTDNHTQMADLGVIDLSNPQLSIYQKYYIPSQTVFLPPNVTKQDALNALFNHIIVQREATPADTTQWILVFFAVFGTLFAVIGFILNFVLPAKDSNSNTRNTGKRGKGNRK
jgi:hypothetical protein